MKKTSVSRSHSRRPPALQEKPRKVPVQARSSETVRAIQQATLQVLARYGQRLTTTQVAKRAGVSVGTLYQYYADKNGLLCDVMEQHVKFVTLAVEEACQANHGAALDEMAKAVVSAFIDAKLRDVAESIALYEVMDLPGAREIVAPGRDRVIIAIARMLRTAPGVRTGSFQTTAAVLFTAMVGTVRSLLEAKAPEAQVKSTRRELALLAQGYLALASRATR